MFKIENYNDKKVAMVEYQVDDDGPTGVYIGFDDESNLRVILKDGKLVIKGNYHGEVDIC